MSVTESQIIGTGTNISESQAAEIAKAWLRDDIGQELPIRDILYVPAVKAGGPEGYDFNQPARWLVVFQCDAPEGFYPDHIDIHIDPMSGEVEALPMM